MYATPLVPTSTPPLGRFPAFAAAGESVWVSIEERDSELWGGSEPQLSLAYRGYTTIPTSTVVIRQTVDTPVTCAIVMCMTKQPNRRQVSLRLDTWRKAVELRDRLAEKSGRRVAISDTIDRGLDCLADAYDRGAWLSPQEAAPVWEQRLQDQIASVLAQFVARAMPDRSLEGIVIDSNRRTAIVLLGDHEEPIPLLLAATEAERNQAEK